MDSPLRHSTRLTGRVVVAVLAMGMAVASMTLVGMPLDGPGAMYGTAVPAPQAHLHQAGDPGNARMVLAGGCFWGMELVFSHVKGVTDVVSGYAGGDAAHANYADSSSGRYGDAEAIRITYDRSRISYGQLLRIYFSVAHDPTQLNRQGPDVGTQYRSQIFTANADQARVAHAYIRQLDAAQVFDQPLATRVSIGESFFTAEDYHQDYAIEHPHSLYIRLNDLPKLRALEHRYPQQYTTRYADGTRESGP